jgi:hypothetical protein
VQGHSIYRVNHPRVISEKIEGELIILNLERGCYFSTDRVGADVWALIESGHTGSSILEALRFRYDGDQAEMAWAVSRFVELLELEGLITADDEPRADRSASPGPESRKAPFQAPDLQKYTDMRDMLLLDPVHDVEASGWPVSKVEESWPSAESGT